MSLKCKMRLLEASLDRVLLYFSPFYLIFHFLQIRREKYGSPSPPADGVNEMKRVLIKRIASAISTSRNKQAQKSYENAIKSLKNSSDLNVKKKSFYQFKRQ